MSAEGRVARARALIGVPFKLHGRQEAIGLDCVGLVALACGRLEAAPVGYALRTTAVERWIDMLDALAVRRPFGISEAGDILLLQAGPAQIHLGIKSTCGLIHADARLGKAVETPDPLPWPLLAAWHLSERD